MHLSHPNSYAAKEEVKSLGGLWDSTSKCWIMPSKTAYDAAFEACENAAKERPMTRFFDDDEDDDYAWLTNPASVFMHGSEPLHGQQPESVKTGLVFTDYGRSRECKGEQWVVLCTYREEETPAMADVGDFLCGCLNSRKWSYMSRNVIASVRWTGELMAVEKAKELYDRFEETHS